MSAMSDAEQNMRILLNIFSEVFQRKRNIRGIKQIPKTPKYVSCDIEKGEIYCETVTCDILAYKITNLVFKFSEHPEQVKGNVVWVLATANKNPIKPYSLMFLITPHTI